MALWGGRFEGRQSPLFRRFNDSLRFDRRLVYADIAGSKCWARAIHSVGVLNDQELASLVGALEAIARDLGALSMSDDGPSITDSGEEDVHSWVESELIRRVGQLGKKLHTGRSRNDQVATDLRLWLAATIGRTVELVRAAQESLVGLADRERATAVPGYTHLQRGQPIVLGHWALAYFEMLDRDAERYEDCRRRVAVSPLGSGALAGTAYAIDREALARDLGFSHATRNSLDSVADRDFALEALSCCAITAIHLSRMAEDLILFASSEFGFVQLDDAVTSGSSLMPQKKNPDALELIRGKAGRILGAQTALGVTLKGLPLAYNKDMQEDKEPLFDAFDHLALSLAMIPPVLDTARVDRAACAAAALGDGTVLSTDLADFLVGKGMPFRDAHETAGRLVRESLRSGTPLHKLPLATMRSVAGSAADRLDEGVFRVLTVEASLSRRSALGGTSPLRVAEAVRDARSRLARARGTPPGTP
ncbi:MAG: argininosuccinate lyase [Phycisphaerales bacterium]